MDLERRDPGLLLLSPLVLLLFLIPGLLGQSASAPDESRDTGRAGSSLDLELAPDDPLLAHLGVEDPDALDEETRAQVEHLILLLPDPLESRFDEIFDRHLGAAQRAIESRDFSLDRFKLPWLAGHRDSEAGDRPYTEDPGVLLYVKKDRLLVVLVIGETSTFGVHKEAFKKAVERIKRFSKKEPIRVLGPTFTGSLTSLELALSDLGICTDRPAGPPVRMISGSVTGIEENPFACPNVGFETTVLPDLPALKAFVRYLQDRKGKGRIALLVESNTGYGRKLVEAIRPKTTLDEGEDSEAGFLSLTYPVHVAALRKVIAGGTRDHPDDAAELFSSRTELSEEERQTIRETLPLFASDSIASTEMALDLLLDSLSRELVSFVGIFASDQKDAFFLVREIRRHVRSASIFLMDADMLQLHQHVNRDLVGAYVVSTYPLFPLNQNWSPPHRGEQRRIVLPSQFAQGVYNAALCLIADDHGGAPELLEYGPPLVAEAATGPPVWVQAVGRNSYWPLALLEPEGRGLSVEASSKASSEWKTIFFRGLETRQSAAMLIVLVVGLWWATFAAVFAARPTMAGAVNRTGPQLFADSVSPGRSTQRRAYLLSLFGALALFTLVSVAINILPVEAALRLGVPLFGESKDWVVIARTPILGVPVIALLVIFGLKLRSTPPAVIKEPIILGTIMITIPCVLMAVEWLRMSPPEQLFLYIRSVNWLSGVSPLLPALFVASTGVLFLVCTLERLRHADGLEECETILMADNGEDRSLIDLELLLRKRLTGSPGSLRMALEVFLILVVIWIALFGLSWVPFLWRLDIGVTVQTYETWWYLSFFAHAYLGIYTCLALAGLRLQLVWSTLQRLHEHVASARLTRVSHELFAGEAGGRPSDLAGHAQMLRPVRQSLVAAGELKAHEPLREAHDRWIPKAGDHFESARQAAAGGNWREEILHRRAAQKQLAGFTAEAAAIAGNERKNSEGDLPPWVEKVERLLAYRHVELLQEVMPQLRLLAVSLMGGLLLMLLAVASYPFQIRDRLMLFNWIVILIAIAGLMRALVQMNRDPILSVLTNTDPNRVTWTPVFILRIIMYGVLPLLGLLGAQFPSSVGRWIPFVNNLMGVAH